MTLAQLFNLANKKSFFSRDDDEVWAALNFSAQKLFQEVQEENRGFFIVFDTSSLTLVPNTEEYALPQAVSQILRLRERLVATDPYSVVLPADDLNSPDFVDAQFPEFADDIDGPTSDFEYYGPYLKMTDAQTVNKVQSIRIEPAPQDTRMTELVYVAKFVEINSDQSQKCIPDEGDAALLFGAVCQLIGDNENTAGQLQANMTSYSEAKTQFMKWVRARQKQRVRQVETYLNDLD